MKTIVEIVVLENGAHRNQSGDFLKIPAGWAEIPAGMGKTETFPFVHITVDGQTVTSIAENRAAWEAAQKEEPEPEATTDEVLNALLGVN